MMFFDILAVISLIVVEISLFHLLWTNRGKPQN